MGLAHAALELVYLYFVFEHLGVQFDEMPDVETDEPNAHSLIERVMKGHGSIVVETDSSGQAITI